MNRRVTSSVVAAGVLAVFGVGRAEGAISSAGSGYWTNPASWSPAQVPTSTDDVIIVSGHTNTIATNVAINIASLTIQTNGVLTHLANGTTAQGEMYKVVLNISSNLTIDLGGQINVDGKGYAPGYGPGAGVGNSGSSHGGIGTPYGGGGPGPTYGSLTAPTNLGSGSQGSVYGGGGAVILNVTGASTLSGTISANGRCSPNGWNSPGGSVFITTGTISGSPTITANGNVGGGVPCGGGRIAIILTGSGADFTNFAGATITAYGGLDGAAAGTIYKENKAQAGGQGAVTINNNNYGTDVRVTTAIPSNQTWTVPTIILTNAGVLGIPTNVTFDLTGKTVTGDSVNKNAGITLQGGALITPAVFSYTNYFIRYLSASTFSPTSLTIGSNARFICDVPYTLSSNLTVKSGGDLTHDVNGSMEVYKLDLTVNGDFTLESGGTVDVNAKGCNSPALGSHGGVGGPHTSHPSGGGLTYGSITAPTNLGCSSIHGVGIGNGGGAVILNVTGASDISGTIRATGGDQSGWSAPGGSVYIRTKTITGSGTITANGYNSAAPAGGGRIAIILTGSGADFSNFSGATLNAYGGDAGAPNRGAAGTIYKQTQGEGPGRGLLLIDSGNIKPSAVASTLISSNVTDTIVGTVVITNAAIFKIDTNQSLTVNGNWLRGTNTSFMANSNSTVIFASTNPATIMTANIFYNLTAGAAGKTIRFEAGKTNTVNGMLIFQKDTTLLSTSEGDWWYLTLDAGGTQQVGRVTVKDSNAGGGQELVAGRGSANGGHNVNWKFPPGGTVFVVR